MEKNISSVASPKASLEDIVSIRNQRYEMLVNLDKSVSPDLRKNIEREISQLDDFIKTRKEGEKYTVDEF